MESGDSMPVLQGLSNNLYPLPNPPNSSYWYPYLSILLSSSYLLLGLLRALFPISLPVKILKALLFSSNLTTSSVCFNLLDLITMSILGEQY